MAIGVDRLSHNAIIDVVMDWQSVIVAIVAVVVAAVIVRKTWRMFTCHDTSRCSGCNKECSHRK